jgi:hypothetical protein
VPDEFFDEVKNVFIHFYKKVQVFLLLLDVVLLLIRPKRRAFFQGSNPFITISFSKSDFWNIYAFFYFLMATGLNEFVQGSNIFITIYFHISLYPLIN